MKRKFSPSVWEYLLGFGCFKYSSVKTTLTELQNRVVPRFKFFPWFWGKIKDGK